MTDFWTSKEIAGRTLDLRPRNASPHEILSRIVEKTTALVVLEPGDATRYEFLISAIPADQHPMGWDPDSHLAVITMANLTQRDRSPIVDLRYEVIAPHLADSFDGYTAVVIADFLTRLHRLYKEEYL